MKVSIDLIELAARIGAQLAGATTPILIEGIATLTQARDSDISFFTHRAYRAELIKTKAAAVILAPENQRYCKVPVLMTDNPYLGYARAAIMLNPPEIKPAGIHPTAWVSPKAIVDATVLIGAQTVVEAGAILETGVEIGPSCVIESNVKVGAGSRLVAHVTLCSGTQLGQRILIHPGAVIGADGFGLANDHGTWVKIPQLGGVIIGDDVEIGANTTIDKGALENTVIGTGVKIDNQVQIAHNVRIGDHTAIAGCVGIAGSTHIGRYCMIAGGVGIVGHIEIADHVQLTGGSIVLQSISQAGIYSSGTPLQLNQAWHRNYHRFKSLDEIAQRLKRLERKTET